MAEGDGLDDISYVLNGFYDDKKKSSGACEVGQIVFSPVLETAKEHLIADALRTDSYTHFDVTFRVRPQQGGDFRSKDKRVPIALLKLDAGHEMVLTRAKMRPCLIVAKAPAIDPSSVPEGPQRKSAAGAMGTPTYLLAPMYSVSTATDRTSFGPVMVARIKCLMYPNFLYMRPSGLTLPIPGVARLDRLFMSPLSHGVECTDVFVIRKVLAICHEQIRMLFGEAPSAEYLEARELLMACLPETAKAP